MQDGLFSCLTPLCLHALQKPFSQGAQEGSVEPGTPEGKVGSRPGMLHLPIHGAGVAMVGGMFPRTQASCYTPKLKVILLYRKQNINLVFSVKKNFVVMGQINFWHELTKLTLILIIYDSNLSSV